MWKLETASHRHHHVKCDFRRADFHADHVFKHSHAEFHENPTACSVTDTRSQIDGQGFHISSVYFIKHVYVLVTVIQFVWLELWG